MSDAGLILQHYDISHYAEKARLAFSLKGLVWCSVPFPMVFPKPIIMHLADRFHPPGAMQIGANIYCDTLRIAMELQSLRNKIRLSLYRPFARCASTLTEIS